MAKIPIDFSECAPTPRPRRKHACGACGKIDFWGDDWYWYGSQRELEDEKPLAKFCSDDCKAKGEGLGMDYCRRKTQRVEAGQPDADVPKG